MMPTSKPDVYVTQEELHRLYVAGDWATRLDKCKVGRVDDDTEFAEGEKDYRRKRLSKHFENGVHVAFTIEYLYHDRHSALKPKMLLIEGARHICP